MSAQQMIYIDGDGIEWDGLFGTVTLRACSNNDAGADLINIFAAAEGKAEPVAFAVEFPWNGDRQETRKAIGTVEQFSRGEEFVDVLIKCSEPPTAQITKRR